ncbi:MAG: hypothetical protein AB8H12_18300 [Lewinella sp.]
MLKQACCAKGVVGKWHLGLGDGTLDRNEKIAPGPLEIGFDYCYLIPATGDQVPTVYIEDHSISGLEPDGPLHISYGAEIGDEPTGRENPELLLYLGDDQRSSSIVNGISRIGLVYNTLFEENEEHTFGFDHLTSYPINANGRPMAHKNPL